MATPAARPALSHWTSAHSTHSAPQTHVAHEAASPRQKVLFVTSEIAGLAKTGGLGDVARALPTALSRRHDVRVLMPAYAEVLRRAQPVRVLGELPGQAHIPPCRVGRTTLEDGLQVYLLLCPELYQRSGNAYLDEHGRDWCDNHIRFGRLCLAAAQLTAGPNWLGWQPDLLHLNDWPSALAPCFLSQPAPVLLTIHNLGYQGLFHAASGADLGLDVEQPAYQDLLHHQSLCFLKAGIVHADRLSTVSQTYAEEIVRPGIGCGLEEILAVRLREGQLTGITNGIDPHWDAATDPALPGNFHPGDWRGKALSRRYASEKYDVRADGPLFVVISRLAEQKGIDLTEQVAGHIVAHGGNLVVMGQGEPALEQRMCQLQQRHPAQIAVHIGFDEIEARRLFAGSDFLLMPSRYEPCGLSQMYAQRFASLPIARRTGGLVDTITDGATGFLFDDAAAGGYQAAIDRAFSVYQCPRRLRQMRRQAMRAPRSWHHAAEPYHRLYQQLLRDYGALPVPAARQAQA